VVLFLLTFSVSEVNADNNNFDELEYFDKQDITENGIMEVRLEIFTHAKFAGAKKSCYQSVTRFDDEARITGTDLRQLASANYFDYQQEVLVDWGWKDKVSGEKTSIAKELANDKKEQDDNRQSVLDSLQERVNNKTDFKEKHLRHFTDPCLGADGDYEIVFDTSANLPVEAIDTLISKDNTSAKKLFMYFKYVVYK